MATTIDARQRLRGRSPIAVVAAVVMICAALLLPQSPAGSASPGDQAQAILRNGAGTPIGVVSFSQRSDGVSVQVLAGGLTPGFHGFHVHDVGQCDAPSFTSAGGHWNPHSAAHQHHSGDLPVLRVGADGVGRAVVVTDRFTVGQLLAADVAVIIHEGRDNLANIPDRYKHDHDEDGIRDKAGPDAATLATGDAGARAACGVVVAGLAPMPQGYRMVASDGGVFTHGDAGFHGSQGDRELNAPVVGGTATRSGSGYWMVATDGGIFSHGDAQFHGSLGGTPLNDAVVGMATPPADAAAALTNNAGAVVGWVTFTQHDDRVLISAHARNLAPGFHGFHIHDVDQCDPPGFTSAGGHWNPVATPHGQHAGDLPPLLVAADGTADLTTSSDAFTVADLLAARVAVVVHAGPDNLANIPNRYSVDTDDDGIGDVPGPDTATLATGDAGARNLCGVVQRTGAGYWLAASDGGVFTFGNLPFLGSAGGIDLNSPVVGMAPTPTGRGYWLVAADGGIFSFGDASFFGSTGAISLNAPVVGMAPTPTGRGYWLVAADGGIFSFGDASFLGSAGDIDLVSPAVGLQATRTSSGYRIVAADGGIFSFGDARFFCSQGGSRLRAPVVGLL